MSESLFIKTDINITTTEQNVLVCSSKSEVEVTNNRRLCLYC